ncbi:MAG: ATP-binding cassette domain-containing protein [Asgard group archaeon]|nr:ATP-binding cassette domain-containing protein [Asgard group archaeon]
MDLPKNYFSKKTIEIQLNDVSKVYDERKLKIPALSSVNLKFFTNELAFIIGPSGSGKSTFIKLITGLESVTSGELIVRNNSLNELDDGLRADFRMKNFGIVSQQGDLHPTMTITRNLFLKQIFSGHRISDSYFTQENIESILNEFQITHRKDSYPLEISGGELQRASLAVALFDNPQILVLDEPTANMDAELASEVMSNIYDLHSKTEKMILITTHDFSLVRDNTRIIELTDGKVTHDGLAIIKEE